MNTSKRPDNWLFESDIAPSICDTCDCHSCKYLRGGGCAYYIPEGVDHICEECLANNYKYHPTNWFAGCGPHQPKDNHA